MVDVRKTISISSISGISTLSLETDRLECSMYNFDVFRLKMVSPKAKYVFSYHPDCFCIKTRSRDSSGFSAYNVVKAWKSTSVLVIKSSGVAKFPRALNMLG